MLKSGINLVDAPNSQSDVLQQLKERTADLHRGMEAEVPLANPQLSLQDYTNYLARLFPFYKSVEGGLKNLRGLSAVVDDLDERWKTDLIAHDLRELGAQPELPPHRPSIPDLQTVPQGLGCLYVLEGSTLGSQIPIRMVRAKLGDGVADKTRFLASYGNGVGEKWRRLCADLTRALQAPGDLDAAIASARTTFASFHDWQFDNRDGFDRERRPLSA